MAYQDMRAELRGSVPKLPFAFTGTLINRAYRVICESNLWSFNLFESAWVSPPIINAGTATVTQGLPTVSFDATAQAALVAGSTLYSLITQRQFRIGVGGVYNIISYNSGTGVATLDRPFLDPSMTATAYTVYQAYYVAPMSDFLGWLSVRNTSMFLDLGLDETRAGIDARDPQRSWYQFPTEVVPWGVDIRGLGTATPSSTLGYPLFELWGQAVTPFTYQCYGIRRGQPLVNPTDTLPYALGEDIVLAKAREYAYEWAEANKDMSPRSSGPDFRFLIGKTQDEYGKLLKMYRRQDREFVNNWLSIRNLYWSSRLFGYYNTISGVAGPYAQM